jgi:flagellar protein FlgJ
MNHLPTDISRFQAQQSYTDLNQLNDIRQLGQKDQSLALKKVAQQFESMFMHMMLKSMRSANDVFAKDNPLNSFEVGFHRDMLDHQLSLSLSEGKQLGLAEALYRQLHRSYLPPSKDSLDNSEGNRVNGEFAFKNTKAIVSNNPYLQSSISSVSGSVEQRRNDVQTLDAVNDPQTFIDTMTPYAKNIAKEMGVDYRVIVAQAALETGWGQHAIRDRYGNHSFNLFNIKADNSWSGHSVNVQTLEYNNGVAQKESASFRRYETILESFQDYQQFLTKPRYEKALSVADNNHDFIQELQNAGYATDPNYAKKVTRILDTYFN